MTGRRTRSIILFGFTIVLGLVILVSAMGLMRLLIIKNELNRITDLHHTKSKIITEMHQIVNDRTKQIFFIVLTDDEFVRDELFMLHKALANRFVELREQLQNLALSPNERLALDDALKAIRQAQPIQERLADEIMAWRSPDISYRMLREDVPYEQEVFRKFDYFLAVEQQASHELLTSKNSEFRSAIGTMAVLDTLIVVLGSIVTFFVLRYTGRIETALSEEKQLAQITLRSMGDAVITTNKNGCIVYANPTAEQLLDTASDVIFEKPITDLFDITCTESKRTVNVMSLLYDPQAVPAHLDECQLFIKNTNVDFYIEGLVSPIRNDNRAVIGLAMVFRDITHSRNLASQLTWAATHDSLTGLSNRNEFERLLQRAIESATKDRKTHAMLYIDLDQFKIVNDTCGHFAGDKLLQQLTGMIQNEIRSSDVLARLGGDEFGLLLENCPRDQAERIAQQILATIQGYRFMWSEKIFKVGASIGFVLIDYRSGDVAHVLRAADSACYVAKDKGRNRVWIHSDDDADIARRQGEMEVTAKITSALEEERFCLFKQRINPLSDSNDSAPFYELLVRMVMPNNHLMLPMSFIPAAERYGMMINVDRWVIRTALRRLHETSDKEIGRVSINVSGQSFSDEHFLDFVVGEFDSSGASPDRVCFEITETTAIANWARVSRFIAVLRGMGCKFALDDFGSGMSSFMYLKNLPVDYIKIEGAFVRELTTNRINHAMVEAIQSISRVMNIKTIAEFIELDTVLRELGRIGVDYAQGNILHRPEPL